MAGRKLRKGLDLCKGRVPYVSIVNCCECWDTVEGYDIDWSPCRKGWVTVVLGTADDVKRAFAVGAVLWSGTTLTDYEGTVAFID